MPARHTSLQQGLLFEADLIGGSGRRKRVSARHQVKRLDRIFRKSSLNSKNRSGRRNKLSSFGADLCSAISPANSSPVQSGPDVFADALVPQAGAIDARRSTNLPIQIRQRKCLGRHGPKAAGRFTLRWANGAPDGRPVLRARHLTCYDAWNCGTRLGRWLSLCQMAG
jgi:hypothetical protein